MQLDMLQPAVVSGTTKNSVVGGSRSNGTDGSRILPTGSLFDAVSVVLDLSREGRDLMGNYSALSAEDQSTYLSIISSVLQSGVVGNETVDVGGQARVSDATTRLGDEQLRRAPTVRNPRLNITA